MLPSVELGGSCSSLSAIALALVAIGLAGCSADVARFGNSAAYVNEVSGTLSPASSTRLASAPAAVPLPRPRRIWQLRADRSRLGRTMQPSTSAHRSTVQPRYIDTVSKLLH